MPILRLQPLEDRVTPDVGDTLGAAQATGLTGVGSYTLVEPLGDGAAGSKDVDLYALTATAGLRLTVLTTPKAVAGTAADTFVRVFDAAGTQLQANNDAAGTYSRLTITLLTAGTYYVGVSGNPNSAYNPSTGTGTAAGAVGDYTLSLGVAAAVPWTQQGGPIANGQTEGIPGNPVSGAVQCLAPHPTNADILYAAATNGGVWKTTNATAASPTWVPLTDKLGSLSMNALELDPTDPTGNTVIAGYGRTSSFGRDGGPTTGIIRSTDGGATWQTLTNGLPANQYVRGVAGRGSTLVVGVRATTTGIYRSTDAGASFTRISGGSGTGLPSNGVIDLVTDPGNPLRLYVLATTGVYRSDDFGATWAAITPASVTDLGSAGNGKIDVHYNAGAGTNAVYFGYTISGYVKAIFRSADAGANWTSMSVPGTDYPNGTVTGATNASPISITAASHGLATGNLVSISGVRGNTAANGVWTVTNTGTNTFTLQGSAGSGAFSGNGTWTRAYPITAATWPGLITVTSAAHGLSTGNQVTISGAQGNTAANGTWTITRIDANTFSLDYSVAGTGAYTGGGTWRRSEGLQPVEGEDIVPKVPDYAGGQGDIHFSMAADPVSATVVYFGGDRQGLPSNIGASNYTGRLFRGDSTLAAGSQWTPLTHVGTSNNSAPHADSRDIEFDAAGNLLEGDDGGVYRRTSPRLTTGLWQSVIGTLANTEAHSAVFDPVSQRMLTGNQDTGTAVQTAAAALTSSQVYQGDGGVVDAVVEGANSVRYFSYQYLGAFRRETYTAAGAYVAGSGVDIALNIPASGTTLYSVADDYEQFYTPYVVNQQTPTRMLMGAGNFVYESTTRGDSLTRIAMPANLPGMGGTRSLAYGGPSNADAVYASGFAQGNGADQTTWAEFLVRTTAGGAFQNRSPNYPGFYTALHGIAVDPDDWQSVYVLDLNSRVWRTTDAGTTAGNWVEVTGNLSNVAGAERAIAVLDGGAADIVLAAFDNGVYAMSTAVPGVWYEVGADSLPNAVAYDLRTTAAGNAISLGTLGRGGWLVSGASGRFDTTAPTVTGVTRAAASPAVSPTVAFTVSFPEPVAGLTAANFTPVVGVGLTGAGAILSVTPSATGAAWTVTVAAGIGVGTLGLDWSANGAVVDLAGNALTGGSVTGEVYSIDRPRPTLAGTQVNASTDPQRSRVTRLRLIFSAPVTLAADAFLLNRASGGSLSSAAGTIAVFNPGTGVVDLTFSGPLTEYGSLADGAWSLAVNPAAVTNTASGVGMGTGPASFAFHRLYGDINGDATVNLDDLSAYTSAFGTSSGDGGYVAAFDFNADTTVNLDDLTEFTSRFGVSV